MLHQPRHTRTASSNRFGQELFHDGQVGGDGRLQAAGTAQGIKRLIHDNRRPFEISNLFESYGRTGGSQSERTNVPLRPPLFSSSRIRSMVMSRSTALHMSYTVRAATLTAVRASI